MTLTANQTEQDEIVTKRNSPIKIDSNNANHHYNKGYKHFGGVWFKNTNGAKQQVKS